MRLASLAFIAILALAIASCSPIPVPTSATRTPQPGTTPILSFPNPFATQVPTPLPKPHVLRINMGTRPDILDPQRASTNGEAAVLQMVYEGLTKVDQNGRVLPGAASKWQYSEDGKTLTFTLRDGLARADGTPLTARDFEFAFKHALDPRVGAVDASFLDDVHGAVAAYSLDPKSKPEDIAKALDNVGVKSLDDKTLVITFDQPTGYFPTIASTWVSYPSEKAKVETDPDTWWMKVENHNGNGPFKILDIQEQVIKFVPNPSYWGGTSKLDRLEFYWIADPTAALDSYRKGEVDVMRITGEILPQITSDRELGQDLKRGPSDWVTYLGFNVKKAPFTDKNVRRAFSQALDRQTFVHEVLNDIGEPYLSWIPPGTPGYDPTALAPAYDPQAAVKTLVDAGFGTPDKKRVDCNKLGTVKLTYSSTPRNQTLFQFLAGNLTRVFGCPVLLDPIDPGTYPLIIKDPKTAPQIYLITWQEEYPHPQNWLFLQTCSGVYAARIGYCNKDFDAAVLAANQELDYGKAMDKYRAAQKIFVSDLPGAFLWNNENAFLIRPFVKGLWDSRSPGDNGFPGQFGPLVSYDVDTAQTVPGYPDK